MSRSFLPKDLSDDIDKISVWDSQDVAQAGSKDPALIATDDGSLNGNWIRFRNFVNALAQGLLTKQAAIATDALFQVGTLTATSVCVINEMSVTQLTTEASSSRTVALPNKSGTVAMTSDITESEGVSQAAIEEAISALKLHGQFDFSFAGVLTDDPAGEFAVIGGRQSISSTGSPLPACTITSILVTLTDGTVVNLFPLEGDQTEIVVPAPAAVSIYQSKFYTPEVAWDGYQSIPYVGGTGQGIGRTTAPVLYGTVFYTAT